MAYGWIERGPHAAVPAAAHIVAAELEITMLDVAPQTILFAALQTNFESNRGVQYGANHLGLQWNSRSPCGRAVNFGGYVDPAGVDHGVPYEESGRFRLDTGQYLSPATFPVLANGDRRTAEYEWTAGTAVHLSVHHLGAGTWRATIDGVPYRDSYYPGTDRIGAMVFWTEYGSVTCRCRFSNLAVHDLDGTRYDVGPGVRIDAHRPGQQLAYFDDVGLVFEPPTAAVVIPDGEVVTVPVSRPSRTATIAPGRRGTDPH